MKQKKKLVNVRLSEQLIQDLQEVSEDLEVSQSQIIRDAIREKVASLKGWQSDKAKAAEPKEEAVLAVQGLPNESSA